MTDEVEAVLDRRRLRRSLTTWRAVAIAALVLGAGLFATRSEWLGAAGRAQIARVAIEGAITEDREQLAMLKKIAEAKHVKGVVVFINSPGGTTTGGEALFDALRKVAEKKPVVGQFGTVAASAGYIAGLGTDHIVSRGNTITGSVGVLAQWPEVTELMGKLGIKFQEVKSGELKASPTPFKPMDERSRQVMQDTIDDGFRWFVNLVETRRGIKIDEVPGLREGRIYSGREALTHRLVDEIGGEREAVLWLEREKGVPPNLKVVSWKPESENPWSLLRAEEGGLTGLLADGIAGGLRRVVGADTSLSTLGLDGLISVWQPGER